MLKINDLERHHAALRADLSRAVDDVLNSGWYVLGKQVAAFERAFADFCGTADAIGVGNGTDALELALRALDVGAGDQVVTVANAGMYASSAILALGGVPVFVDVDASSLTMNPAELERALGPRCKAIVLTHLYGRLADVQAVLRIADARGIPVIEDCAQAHGAAAGGKRAGSFGKIGCFSFYPTKNLGAVGDGGAVTTSDPELARRLRSLRQYGWSEKYVVSNPGGRNTRLDELQAAVLLTKLPRLEGWNARRAAIAARYSDQLRHPAIEAPATPPGAYVAHLYVVRSTDREGLRAHLRQQGIATEVHYPVPDHRQPMLSDRCRDVKLPVTEHAAQQILTLPCFPEMTDAEVERVIAACVSWKA